MKIIKGKTFADVYREVLYELHHFPKYVTNPRSMKIKEIINLIIEIEDPTSNMFINPIRKTPQRYLAGEMYWYFQGREDVEFISKYSKFWKKLTNPDGVTVNSAYGNLLFRDLNEYNITEWQWALKSLIEDKDTRQAIIRFNKPKHSFVGNKDFVCTLNGIFNIRNDKLIFTVIMRSQDEILGRTFDIPFFTLLQQQMRNHLLPYYPDLKLGSFIHHNVSSHIYEKDFELVEDMLRNQWKSAGLPKLRENLINPDGSFNDNFWKSDDELITWIRENMK